MLFYSFSTFSYLPKSFYGAIFFLQSLQDTVARFTSMNHISKDLSGSEDGSHIFEVSLIHITEFACLQLAFIYASVKLVDIFFVNAKAVFN